MKKTIIYLLIVLLLLPLYGCSESKNDDADKQLTNTERNDVYNDSIEKFVQDIDVTLKDSCKEVESVEANTTLSKDKKTIICKYEIKNFDEFASYTIKDPTSENVEGWDSVVESAIDLCSIIKNKTTENGFNVDVKVEYVDSANTNSPDLVILNGEVTFDCVHNVLNYKISDNNTNISTNSKEKTNALAAAKNYLSFSAFSYKGLIEQLEFEGYSNESATYAVDNCGANWNDQAVKMAKNYLSFSSYSKIDLIEQLEFEGFTREQAEYGVNQTGYGDNSLDSGKSMEKTNALAAAKNYLSFSAFSYKGLIEQLEFEGYSNESATYAVDNCGANWNDQAVKMAKNYLSFSSYSKIDLIEQLEFEGFTREQAEYGVSQNGY